MAEIIPPLTRQTLARMTAGEKRLAERLRALLEDDYLVWYDIPVGKTRRCLNPRAAEDDDEKEQAPNARLLYVGMTRAQDCLLVTSSRENRYSRELVEAVQH